MSANDLKQSSLRERHEVLGAKMADFGGWLMPIEYAGAGVLAEHKAVRDAVGVFDVSHLGKATVRGTGAVQFLNAVLTNDIDRIAPGRAQYTLLCDEQTGGVVDDLILYLNTADEVFVVPNAANTTEVIDRLQAVAPPGIEIHNQHEQFGVIAVQGPRSAGLLQALGLPADIDYMAFEPTVLGDVDLTVCRTGYTGERGYELIMPAQAAVQIWDALLESGSGLGATACGLGARDTLRTEMGYPLHGQDLSPQITPNQARLGWAVGWAKPVFAGRDALLAERAAKAPRLLWGVASTDRGIPRPGMQVHRLDGEPAGRVTTGTFSPSLRKGIGLALIDRSSGIAEGDDVAVDVRGRQSVMTVVKPPFVPSRVR